MPATQMHIKARCGLFLDETEASCSLDNTNETSVSTNPIRILHITQYCHADSVGGTERYILDLIRGQMHQKIDGAIGWLSTRQEERLCCDGITIYPLPGTSMQVDVPNVKLHGATVTLFDEYQPTVVHFHTFGRCEAAIAELATQRGLPYVFSYHSPAWTCRRGDLMRFGRAICDGEVRALRCAACKLQERIAPAHQSFAWILALASVPICWLAADYLSQDRRRRVAFVSDTGIFARRLRTFLEHSEVNFSCAEWSVPLLLSNGATTSSIQLCPQGVGANFQTKPISQVLDKQHPKFVIAFIGRVVPVKGVHILLEAFSRLRQREVELRIYGWPTDLGFTDYHKKLATLATEDGRVQLIDKLGFEAMRQEYADIDLVCIPSIWPETGPLVLFEALNEGIPVFGSSSIGQIELLRARGTVVETNDVATWVAVLSEALSMHKSGSWRAVKARALSNGEMRTMVDVAREVAFSYLKLLCKGADSNQEPYIA